MDASTLDLIFRAVEILSIIGAGSTVVFKLGSTITKFELIGSQQAREIAQLQEGVKAIASVVTQMALADQRQDMFEDRINRMEKLVDEVRHGEGFVLPINPRPLGSP